MHVWIYFGVISINLLLVWGNNCPSNGEPASPSASGKTVNLDASGLRDDGYLRTCSCTLSSNDGLQSVTVTSDSKIEGFEFVVNGNERGPWHSGVRIVANAMTIHFRQLQQGVRLPAFCFTFEGAFGNKGKMRKFQIDCDVASEEIPRVTATTATIATTTRSTTTATSEPTTSTNLSTVTTSTSTTTSSQQAAFMNTRTPVAKSITTHTRSTSTTSTVTTTPTTEHAISAREYCSSYGTPALKVCQRDAVSDETAVYLDSAGVPLSQNASCMCWLNMYTQTGGTPKANVRLNLMREDPGNITLSVGGVTIDMVENAENSIPYAVNMPIRFEKNTNARELIQCFQITTDSGSVKNVSIRCSSDVPIVTTSSTSIITVTNAPTTTNASINTNTSDPSTTAPTTSNNGTDDPSTTEDQPLKGPGADNVQDKTNIGVIAGAAAGAFVVIAAVIIVIVVMCRRRSARSPKRHEETSDPDDKDDPYNMTINAGYMSVDAFQTQHNQDVQRDPRGYALVNKPKPAPKPAPSSSGTEYAEYNHLNDILDNRTPDNVYNTAGGAVEDADMGDYNRLNELPHSRTPDNVYNTASAGGTEEDVDMGDYNRLNEIQAHNVADNLYSVANARGNTDSVYNHASDRT